jgi:hypothetical protein
MRHVRPITKAEAEATVREVLREAVATQVEACARRWRERETRSLPQCRPADNDPVASW